MKKLVLLWAMVFLGFWAMGHSEPRNQNPTSPDAIYQNDRDLSDAVKQAQYGKTDGSEPCSGCINQYVSSTTAAKSFPTSGDFGDFVSMPLTAGEWDITLCFASVANGATVPSIAVGISTVTGNSSATLVAGDNFLENIAGPVNGVSQESDCIANWRWLSTLDTTIYGKYSGSYSVAVPTMQGTLRARRR